MRFSCLIYYRTIDIKLLNNSHVYFKPGKKRQEPTETRCQYCEVEHSTNMGYNHFIPLYKENDSTNIIVYHSVKYNKLPVGIPGCKSCLLIPLDAETKGARIAWGIAVSVIVLSFLIWGLWSIFAFAVVFRPANQPEIA